MGVAVIGASMTKFGQRDAWIRELLSQAGEECLTDAGVAPGNIDYWRQVSSETPGIVELRQIH